MRLMEGDAYPFFIGISVSYFSIGNQEISRDKMISMLLRELGHQETLHISFEHYLEQIRYS